MIIRNTFSPAEIKELVSQVSEIILHERQITNRKYDFMLELFEQESFYIAHDDSKKIWGFIAKHRLTNNYYELMALYVVPKLRGTGLADLLIKAAMDKRYNYIFSAFQKKIIKKTTKYGFVRISLLELPPTVLVKYLLTRNFTSIGKHLFKQKSTLCIKRAC